MDKTHAHHSTKVLPIWKFIFLINITFGFYGIYWFYQNWKNLKSYKNLDISPGWKTLSVLIPFYGFYVIYQQIKDINNYAEEAGVKKVYSPILIVLSLIFIATISRLSGDWMFMIALLSQIPLAIIQKTLNSFWKKVEPEFETPSVTSRLLKNKGHAVIKDTLLPTNEESSIKSGYTVFAKLVSVCAVLVIVVMVFTYPSSNVAVVFGYLLALFLFSFLLGIIPFLILRNKINNPKTVVFGICLILVGLMTLIVNLDSASQQAGLDNAEMKEIVTDKGAENSEIIGNLYRNKKYGFRIKFPVGWKIEEGDGVHIVQKATNGNATISVMVQQVDLDGEERVNNIKEMFSLEDMVSSSLEEARKKFSNVMVLGSGETEIDNQPAYWFEYSMSYRVLGNEVNATTITYLLFKNDTSYGISAGSVTNEYVETKPDIEKSVATFVFEK